MSGPNATLYAAHSELGKISCWSLSGLYCAVSVAAVVQLIRLCVKQNDRKNPQVVLHVFVVLFLFARGISFGLLPVLWNIEVFQTIATFPSMFSFSAFLYVIAFWGDLTFRSRGKYTQQRLMMVCTVVNVIFYILGIIVYSLYNLVITAERITYTLQLVAGMTITLVLVIGGAVFSFMTYVTLRNYAVVAGSIQRLARKVGIVGVICVSCFFLRALVLITTGVITLRGSPETIQVVNSPLFYCIYTICYSVICEVFPMCLLLYFMGVVPGKDDVGQEQVGHESYMGNDATVTLLNMQTKNVSV
eukprot:TRINITY_DN13605_c0_g1_i1.p1 TRINITY_DN13605_c0_g1~~TRINITY_DN13605_c0_g1_i1.p1  ORF type:complete len:303 (+),score=37.92 TRINITY_DN13605_c0_g1_i1:56-964(+)